MWPLRIVGGLYLVSGLWCALNPELAAGFLGFTLLQNGLTEFFSVYGGLQVGLAMAMILASFKPAYLAGGVFFAWVTSLGLLGFRIMGVLLYGADAGVYAMAALELAIVLLLTWPLFKPQKACSETSH